MRGIESPSVIRKPDRSSGAGPVFATSTHSSSREENVPLPSQSRAGPAMISLSRSGESAHAEIAPERRTRERALLGAHRQELADPVERGPDVLEAVGVGEAQVALSVRPERGA